MCTEFEINSKQNRNTPIGNTKPTTSMPNGQGTSPGNSIPPSRKPTK